jgi:predicted RNA-binding protein with RPS1 domain
MLEQRALARRRADRRPSLKELAAQPGIEREGVVVKVASYGVVVNVGARRPGLVHISKLQSGNGRKGAFIERVEAVCEVGDRVVVQVLPRSTAQRLSLRLIRVFPRDESERAQALALLRRDETLDPRFARFEDAEIGGVFVSAAEAALAVDEAAAWAAYETQADEEEEDDEDDEDDEDLRSINVPVRVAHWVRTLGTALGEAQFGQLVATLTDPAAKQIVAAMMLGEC